mmetsp:Transcript_1035/g.1669  ORF Transcript_1035/g.1669 Transcript_1035/m.1669 type:complete len:153 (-) Transcript_1035:79-537(-)
MLWNRVDIVFSDSSSSFIAAIFIVHVTLLLFGGYLCYKTKNVNDALAESSYISMAMFSSLQVFFLATPVLIIVAENPISNMFIRTGVIFLNDCSCQCLIFLPKIRHWIKGTKTMELLSKSKSDRPTINTMNQTTNQAKIAPTSTDLPPTTKY